MILGILPDIDEGSFEPVPDPVTAGDKTVNVSTPAYVIGGNDVTIVCNIVSGTRPITIKWFRNGVEVTSFGNVSTITITNVDINNDGDMYLCRAENLIGFDEETTFINVFGEHFSEPCMLCMFDTFAKVISFGIKGLRYIWHLLPLSLGKLI